MTTRLAALQNGMPQYDGQCLKHEGAVKRWTGSGKCSLCQPRKRGTLVQAMEALYKYYDVTLERALEDDLPCFKAVCRHGHNSWRYVKTPHICLKCVELARPPRPARPVKVSAPPRCRLYYWYFVQDLRSGLIVSNIVSDSTVAGLLKREIKKDHPSMILIVASRRQTPGNERELRGMAMLRLDRYPERPNGPEYTKY